MNNKNKLALILCLDQNKYKKYEYECLTCVKCWTSKINYLANIDIIIYIDEKSNINDRTLKQLQKYKNIQFRKYIYPYKHNYLMLNTLYCQYLFERDENKYQYGIYIDLDLYLMRPLPIDFIYNKKNIFCIYTAENDKSDSNYYRFQNNQLKKLYTFNTEFIINNRENRIFEKLVHLIDNSEYEKYFNTNFLYKNDTFYYEEGIYDYAFYKNIINDKNSQFIEIEKISKTPGSYLIDKQCFIDKHILSLNDYIRTNAQLMKFKLN